MAEQKTETPRKTVKSAVKGWTNRGMSVTLAEAIVKPRTNRVKTFAQDVKSGIKGASSAAGGGILGAIAAAAQTPNIIGISAMGQQGYGKRKGSPSTPGGKKPLFSRDYPLSESPTPTFNNQK